MTHLFVSLTQVAKYAAPKGTKDDEWDDHCDDDRMLELENGANGSSEKLRESWHITHKPEWIEKTDEGASV